MNINNHQKRHRRIGTIFFLLYLLGLCYCLFLADIFGRTGDHNYAYNLVPFREIKRFLLHSRKLGIKSVFINLAGNIICFIPFGFYLPIQSRRFRRIGSIFLTGFAVSLLIETIQLVTRVGCFDVDDMILNTLGCVIGYSMYFWIYERKNEHACGKDCRRA